MQQQSTTNEVQAPDLEQAHIEFCEVTHVW